MIGEATRCYGQTAESGNEDLPYELCTTLDYHMVEKRQTTMDPEARGIDYY
jgi:hypothetical protein